MANVSILQKQFVVCATGSAGRGTPVNNNPKLPIFMLEYALLQKYAPNAKTINKHFEVLVNGRMPGPSKKFVDPWVPQTKENLMLQRSPTLTQDVSGLSGGAIAGIVIASIVVATLLGVMIYGSGKKHRKNNK